MTVIHYCVLLTVINCAKQTNYLFNVLVSVLTSLQGKIAYVLKEIAKEIVFVEKIARRC